MNSSKTFLCISNYFKGNAFLTALKKTRKQGFPHHYRETEGKALGL